MTDTAVTTFEQARQERIAEIQARYDDLQEQGRQAGLVDKARDELRRELAWRLRREYNLVRCKPYDVVVFAVGNARPRRLGGRGGICRGALGREARPLEQVRTSRTAAGTTSGRRGGRSRRGAIS